MKKSEKELIIADDYLKKNNHEVPENLIKSKIEFSLDEETLDYSEIQPNNKFSGSKEIKKKKAFKKVRIGKGFKPDFSLDLHGETKNSAKNLVDSLLNMALSSNLKSILIITGKGFNSSEPGGILREYIWNYLENQLSGKCKRMEWAPSFLGGKGAILIILN